jgi:hypothetical protein
LRTNWQLPRDAAGVTMMEARAVTMFDASRSMLHRGLSGLIFALAGAGSACAGETNRAFEIGALQLVEIAPAGAGQRPHRALRIRLDGATKAFRSMGLDAADCGSVLRSTSGARRLADAGSASGGPRYQPTLFVALNCRF